MNNEVSAAAYSEIPPDTFGREAKHFTETRVLNREVSLLCSLVNIEVLHCRI